MACESSTWTPLSKVVYDTNTGTGPYSYSGIEFLDDDIVPIEDQLEVYMNGDLLTITTDYTQDTGAETITLIVAKLSTDYLVLSRATERDSRYVTFTDASKLNQSDQNLDSDQLFLLVQEALDAANESINKGVTDGLWNGQEIATKCFAPATVNDGLVTLGQMQIYVAGGETAIVDAVTVINATGDGTETDVRLTSVRGIVAGQVYVTVDGVMQEAGSSTYSISQEGDVGYPGGAGVLDDYVIFSTAPANNASIECRVISGTVNAVLNTDILSIEWDEITYDSGVANRFVSINASGTPSLAALDHDEITDFDAGVQANRIDQMAAPSAEVNMGGQIVGTAGVATDADHLTRKDYVDTQDDSHMAAAISSSNAYTDAKSFTATELETTPTSFDSSGSTYTFVTAPSIITITGTHDKLADGVGGYASVTVIPPTSGDKEIVLNYSGDDNKTYGIRITFISSASFTLECRQVSGAAWAGGGAGTMTDVTVIGFS